MRWILLILTGPMIWALAFAGIYALHGLGCARGWSEIPSLLGSRHITLLAFSYGAALILGSLAFWLIPAGGQQREAQILRASLWIGLVSTALTLFPVLILTSC